MDALAQVQAYLLVKDNCGRLQKLQLSGIEVPESLRNIHAA